MWSEGYRSALVLAMGVCVTGCASADNKRPGQRLAPAPAPAPAPQARAERRSFTLVASGDVLLHQELIDQAAMDEPRPGRRDFAPLLAAVKPVVAAADLAICHLETPLAPKRGPIRVYPWFSAPPEIAQGLADIGYDTCSTASNHTLDDGPEGVARTLDTLDAAGLRHTGSARSAEEAATPVLYDVRGVKVGHVAFSYGFNGRPLPADKPWLANRTSAEAVLGAARAARAAGAEVVIASLHWGAPYQHAPTSEQTALAEQLLADPALDLIVGHHAHVVQPFAKLGEKWVAYGLGNHLARHAQLRGATDEGVIARFRFVHERGGWRMDRAEYVPTMVVFGPPMRLIDLSTAAPRPRYTAAIERIDRIVRGGGIAASEIGSDVLVLRE